MTELIILLVIIAVIFFFRKSRPSVSPEPVREVRPDIIEDSSHLKAELTSVKESLAKTHQELGQLQSKLGVANLAYLQVNSKYVDLQQNFDKLQSQKKSGEVRLGHLSEQLIPLLPEFPVPINTLKFFGNPLDYISIDLDSEWISFIEVKSGGSVLSEKQRKIRKMIQDKKVRFFEVRIDDKGVKVK